MDTGQESILKTTFKNQKMQLKTFEEIVTPELSKGAIINNRHPGFCKSGNIERPFHW